MKNIRSFLINNGIFLPLVILLSVSAFQTGLAQSNKYYVATGKDSVTYLASNKGLVVLKRDLSGNLYYHGSVNPDDILYTKGLDIDNYLIFASDQQVDAFSLADKENPEFIGSLPVSDIKTIRPFGNHFAVIRGGDKKHYIIGVENDSVKILSSIYAAMHYYNRLPWYPETVYPYFFSKVENPQRILMHKYDEAAKDFIFVDTLAIISSGYSFVQMFGGRDRFFFVEKKSSGSSYLLNTNKYEISNDSLTWLSTEIRTSNIPFTDEIECTEEIIRFNNWYKTLDGISLSEPGGLLGSYPNLSEGNIYNTVQWGVPAYTKMYYSTKIISNTIHSAEFNGNITNVPGSLSENYSDFSLDQNYPNPFNPSTRIKYTLPQKEYVKITISDALGREVQVIENSEKESGVYEIIFNGSSFSSGIYYYTIYTGDYRSTRKMMLLK